MSAESSELTDLVAEITADTQQPQPGHLPQVWDTMVSLGLNAVGVAEQTGGSGGSVADLIVLTRALAGRGASTPIAEAALANAVLAASGNVGTFHTIAVHRGPVNAPALTLPAVPWARYAHKALVVTDDQFFAVDIDSPAVAVEPGLNIGGDARDQITVEPSVLQSIGTSELNPTRVLSQLLALRAAAITGAIDGVFRLAREHVRTREQFGKPLIEIPSVANTLAEIKVLLIESSTALQRATWALTNEPRPSRLDPAALAAHITAARTGSRAARLGQQLHGALGITSEYPLHHYTTRIWGWRDEPLTEIQSSTALGEVAFAGGESEVWDSLTV